MDKPLSLCARCGSRFDDHPWLVQYKASHGLGGPFEPHTFELNERWESDALLNEWRQKHILGVVR